MKNKKTKLMNKIFILLFIFLNLTIFSVNSVEGKTDNTKSNDWTVGVSVGDKLVMKESFCKGDCEVHTGVGTNYTFQIVEINENEIIYDQTFSKNYLPEGNFTVSRSGYDNWLDIFKPVTTTNTELLKNLIQTQSLGNRNVTLLAENTSEITIQEIHNDSSIYIEGNFTYDKASGWLTYVEFSVNHGTSFYTEVHVEMIKITPFTSISTISIPSSTSTSSTTASTNVPGFLVEIFIVGLIPLIYKKKKW